jgi:hypothetical protein
MCHHVADMHETWKEQSPCSTDGSGDRDNGFEGINEGVADLSSEDGAVADLQCDNVVQHSGLVQGHRKHSNTGTVHLFTLLLTN